MTTFRLSTLSIFAILACIVPAAAQFRAGHITWELVPSKPNTVRFTVRTSWLRSAGTYVRVVNGTATRRAGYQPVKGDVIRFVGFQTPKVLTTDFQGNDMETYLVATVTSNSEGLPNGAADRGLGKDHTVNDWTYYGNNWFQAVSTYEFTYPRTGVTYPVELQGCCRQQPMRADSTGAISYRDATGLMQLSNTPYTIRSYVRLDRDPPPTSFLPSFFPHSLEDGLIYALDLPILDYPSTFHSSNVAVPAEPAQSWADSIIDNGKQASGDLSSTLSRPATGRRLLQVSSNPSTSLAVITSPSLIAVTAADTGNDARMLPWVTAANPSSSIVTVFDHPGCGPQAQSVSVAVGMDTCPGGPASRWADGGPVANNFSSVLVPANVYIALSDACEYSNPPPMATVLAAANLSNTLSGYTAFRPGNSFPSATAAFPTFPNATSSTPQCWNLPAGVRGSTIRWMPAPDGSTASIPAIPIKFEYLADGRPQASLFLSNYDKLQGNYPVKLRLATGTSSEAQVEFVLHVITTAQAVGSVAGRQIAENTGFPPSTTMIDSGVGSLRAVPMPTGFVSTVTWSFTPASFQTQGPVPFDNLGLQAFGPAGPSASYPASGA
eukprot:CAMPEP_0113675452 /NCGR_PEP_ID=MMETSP0038_2-20120614/8025_1 /TAXON_ID=2898 /ORGANISM="Cryptomonas paramecium" /LENGTH=606 /DNA_ID=CAMNT_0000592231 /DNA_START=35 /DNA_END=1851 /DNA_ORIENTATION=- /assembly_acc=CAM_ASM_000170